MAQTLLKLQESVFDKIAEFLEKPRKHIILHWIYDTLVVLYGDKGEIIAAACWNVPRPRLAKIINCKIREGYRNNGLLKKMIRIGLMKFPSVTNICFERELKYPQRKLRFYRIKQLLQGEK